MCRAIINSSLVGIVHAETRAPGVLMRGPPAAFAAGSSSTPSQAASRQALFADSGRVLANAAGEDDRVQPAEGRGERADLAPDAVAIEVDRELRPRIARGEERAHVAGDARHAE